MSIAHESTKVNLDFLVKELGLRQERNTKVFRKGKIFVVSPSVQNDSNWFDIGESIMDLYNSDQHEGYLLVRFKDRFIMAKLNAFKKKMMLDGTQPNTNKLPPHWKFKIKESANPYIVNMADSKLMYPIQIPFPTKSQLVKFFSKK
ncbi:hypothetical protein [Paenisporosarcina indica]|uniref:hypothetical protein n=1 Tax=Paenisporosarcina indica TaxID=650093 RepID=UPI00094FB3A8|nr:hypothetical protein [Paenisporosarcina indica]